MKYINLIQKNPRKLLLVELHHLQVLLEFLSQRRVPVAASYAAGNRRGPENDHGCPTWMYIYLMSLSIGFSLFYLLNE